jgi:hypothetical protein
MEVAKLIASFLTPITIALVGYFIQRTLAEQNRRWQVQERLADKRAEIYEKIAEDLNKIYCYVRDVGGFKLETPEAILVAKRNVDRNMFAYQAIWPEETFKSFKAYMDSAFATFQGVGVDAKIRTRTMEKRAAREKRGEDWPAAWNERFTEKTDVEHESKYQALMNLISRDLMYLDRI